MSEKLDDERIAACLYFCQGMPTERLKGPTLRELLVGEVAKVVTGLGDIAGLDVAEDIRKLAESTEDTRADTTSGDDTQEQGE